MVDDSTRLVVSFNDIKIYYSNDCFPMVVGLLGTKIRIVWANQKFTVLIKKERLVNQLQHNLWKFHDKSINYAEENIHSCDTFRHIPDTRIFSLK